MILLQDPHHARVQRRISAYEPTLPISFSVPPVLSLAIVFRPIGDEPKLIVPAVGSDHKIACEMRPASIRVSTWRPILGQASLREIRMHYHHIRFQSLDVAGLNESMGKLRGVQAPGIVSLPAGKKGRVPASVVIMVPRSESFPRP